MAYTPTGLNLLVSANSDTSNGSTTQNNPNVWYYNSADALATVQGTAYFSDAKVRGLKLYDIVDVAIAGLLKTPKQYVSAIDATTGAATISAAATS